MPAAACQKNELTARLSSPAGAFGRQETPIITDPPSLELAAQCLLRQQRAAAAHIELGPAQVSLMGAPCVVRGTLPAQAAVRIAHELDGYLLARSTRAKVHREPWPEEALRSPRPGLRTWLGQLLTSALPDAPRSDAQWWAGAWPFVAFQSQDPELPRAVTPEFRQVQLIAGEHARRAGVELRLYPPVPWHDVFALSRLMLLNVLVGLIPRGTGVLEARLDLPTRRLKLGDFCVDLEEETLADVEQMLAYCGAHHDRGIRLIYARLSADA